MRACFFFAQFSGGRNNGKLWRYYNEDLTASNQCHKRNAHTTSHQLTIQRWICTIGKAAKLCTRACWAKRAEDNARSLDTFSACSDSIFEFRRNSRALAKNSTTSDEHRLKFPSKILSLFLSFFFYRAHRLPPFSRGHLRVQNVLPRLFLRPAGELANFARRRGWQRWKSKQPNEQRRWLKFRPTSL